MPRMARSIIVVVWLWFVVCTWTGTGGDPAPVLRGTKDGRLAHVLVFDAGSSGTRVHVFNIRPPRDGSTVPSIDLAVSKAQTLKIKPGLSHFAKTGDHEGVNKNMKELLAFAHTIVPEEQRAETPALLMATAGLRATPADQAEAVLVSVRQSLASSGYRFQDQWARIIPGREEGGLAWVAANYLAGTFGKSSNASVGVIEMGGGSTQVVFRVDDTADVSESDTWVFVDSSGRRYNLYAHSYLDYGQDYAQERLKTLIDESRSTDPCYPAGYKRSGKTDTVKGSGDAEACLELIQSLMLQPSSLQNQPPGSYGREVKARGKLVLTENFANIRKDHSLHLPADFAALTETTETFCAKALQDGDGAANDNWAQPRHCFAASYQVAFLKALQADRLPGVNLEIVSKIGGGSVDWAVGAAVTQAVTGVKWYTTEVAQDHSAADVQHKVLELEQVSGYRKLMDIKNMFVMPWWALSLLTISVLPFIHKGIRGKQNFWLPSPKSLAARFGGSKWC